MCKTNQERRTLGRKIVAWLSLGVFLSTQTMALAAPIMPDNQAHITERPLVQETANGIPLVNITAPTNGGVSMNKYEQFKVEKQGAILNNSYTVSKTELAGFVQGNSNMVNGTAKVIVNQVTSDKPTSMEGYLEVAGQRASVVVANPNGIAVNGGGFLNTSNAVLTTGKPELDAAGNVTNYRVDGGRVFITGDGLDAKTTDSVAILSRVADINAGIWANSANVRTGLNDVNAATLEATSMEGTVTPTDTKPAVALDVSAVGGMYANHVSLVGTEHGVGVNIAGVVAGTQSVSLDANGHLSVSGTLQSDKALSAKANSIDNTKTIASGGTLAIDTQDLTNTGTITSAGDGQIKVTNTLDNKNTIAAGANTEGAITSNGSLSIEAGTLRNTDAVIVSGGTTKINGKEVHNVDNGRIYGGKVSIEADTVENRKNVALEAKLANAMKDMKAAEDALEAAYTVDTTAFKTKAEQDAYLNNIKEKYKDYNVKLAAVKSVQDELENHKGSTIAGQEDVTIKAKNILNAEKSLIYSGNTGTLIGINTLVNHGGTIDALGKGFIKSANFQNTNSSFTAKRVSEQVEKGLNSNNPDDMLETQENKIRIDDKGHSESGQAFNESEFRSLGSGYGAYHNKGTATPMVIYDDAVYETVEQITADEEKAGETRVPDDIVGTLAPTYAYDDEAFETFGIKSLPTPRPEVSGPEQDAWDAQFKPILAMLNDKIQEHNAKAKVYNQKISGVANEKIDRYTIIRTKTLTSHEEVKNSTAGVVRFGGDVQFEGTGTNENSQIAIGGTLTTDGTINQIAKKDQELTQTFGTTESTYTYKRKRPHKSRRRGYNGQVFMTPQVDKGNETPLGVAKQDDKDGSAKISVGDKHRKEVQDFLNPFADTNGTSTGNSAKPNAGNNILNLPTSSLYQIHPDTTAKYVVETDPQFANRKKFLSSDYMYREMKTKPELIEKRLGDGLYEQTLIREQIVNGTGFRFLDGYSDDEAQFKALMDAGVAYANTHGLVPGVSLTAEHMARLTSDMVWLEKATVMVDGQPVEVIYPKVYLKNTNASTGSSANGTANNSNVILKTDGTLMSANKLIMNAKEAIKNEGVIQGRTVILHSATDVDNRGHIVGGQIGVQAGNDINNQGQIIAKSAVELQAKNDINLNNTVDHLTNQDVLNTTSGIAVTGDNGIVVVNAGHDVNLGAATLEALGKDGSIVITAGNDVNSTTDTLSAKKDMTKNSDNYLRTYRKTELGTTIEAGGNVSVGAKNDVKARNLTISSDDGAVKVIGEHDTSIEHGYSESKDAYGIKYKEKGFLNKKETKIKTNDESKDALMSTISGKSVLVGANNDVTLKGTNVVSTDGTNILAGHNIHTDAAEEYALSESSKDVKKSGLMGAGIGVMIGKQQSKDNYRTEESTHRATTLGATNGKVTVQAGDTAHLTTTNAIGKTGVLVTAQEIVLDGNEDVFKHEERHERKSSGLTVSLGGSVVENIDGAIKKQHTASGRNNNKFKQLESKQARDRLGKALIEAKQIVGNSYNGQMRTLDTQINAIDKQLQSEATFDPSLRKALERQKTTLLEEKDKLTARKAEVDNHTDKAIDRAINLQIGIGSSKSVSESKTERRNYNGGTIDSDGAVLIRANSEDAIKGNIKMVGEQIHGRQVMLDATNDIDLQAAKNTLHTESNSTASGWGLSANIGMRTGSIVGGSASVYKASEQGVETGTTHTGTHIVADDALHITSGKDTNLIGSTVTGASVKANIGGNLTVESLQDTNSYHETSRNKGISVSTADMTHFGISGSNVKGNIDSDYTSVTEQAGIHAGDNGLDITVGDTTTLKGAVITSTAALENNKLSTKQLVTEDIQNEASYKAKQSGIAMNTSGLTAKGVLGKINPLGLSPVVTIPVSDSASSTTRSAISENIILEVENKSAADINRDTEHALNAIKPIFDKEDVKERFAYVNAVSAEGFKLIGDISMAQAKRYEEKAANADTDALRERYQREANKWKDGGIYKVALHGGFGAAISNMAGGSSLKGFTAASANELMVGAISKELAKHEHSTIDEQGRYVDNSDVYKLASAVLGGAITNSSLGAGIAISATEHNYLTHEQKLQFDKEFNEAKTKSEKLEVLSRWRAIDQEQERALKSQIEGFYFSKLADEYNPNLYIPVAYDIKRTKEDNNWQDIDYKPYDKIIDSMYGGSEYQLDDVVFQASRISKQGSLLEELEAARVKGLNNLARLDAVLADYQPGTEEFDLAVLHNFNEANHKYHSELYKYKSIGYGLTDSVADNMTFDGAAAAREAMDIEHPNNDYYYGARIAGDVITTIGGGGMAITGAAETGVTIAGAPATLGASTALTPVAAAQTAYGGAVALKSGKSLGEDITLFAKKKSEGGAYNPQKDHMDIEPIKDLVDKDQYDRMKFGYAFKKHSKIWYKKGERSESSSLPDVSEPNSSMDLMFNGKLKQRRYYGADGRPIVDIDYFHNGLHHEFPHKHIWLDSLPNRRSGH